MSALATATATAIEAAVVCRHYGIHKPAAEIDLLLAVERAARDLAPKALRAVNGNDHGAWVAADNNLRNVLAQLDAARAQPSADPA